jgi:hypothetical protein
MDDIPIDGIEDRLIPRISFDKVVLHAGCTAVSKRVVRICPVPLSPRTNTYALQCGLLIALVSREHTSRCREVNCAFQWSLIISGYLLSWCVTMRFL